MLLLSHSGFCLSLSKARLKPLSSITPACKVCGVLCGLNLKLVDLRLHLRQQLAEFRHR